VTRLTTHGISLSDIRQGQAKVWASSSAALFRFNILVLCRKRGVLQKAVELWRWCPKPREVLPLNPQCIP